MADTTPERDEDWSALSSMADGEAGAEAAERCLALWGTDARARARWRDYQLIGDVLRSEELARHDAHDAAFVRAVRDRLAREPALLRPARPKSPFRLGTRAWSVPMAAMAGVAAVAGVVVVLRGAPDGGAALVANQGSAAPALGPTQQQVPTAQAVNGRLIRDARLDRYFTAHRQSANGAALQMPGAVVRSVDTIVLEDR